MDAEKKFLESMEVDEMYLPVTNDLITAFKKSCGEVDISILEQERYNENIVMFRLKLARGTFNIFQLGAITHINNSPVAGMQSDIDKLFKDRLQ